MPAKAKKKEIPGIDDAKLLGLIASEQQDAIGDTVSGTSEVAAQRGNALDMYMGDTKFMPAPAVDRSRAVSRDVFDVVEGVLPDLLEVFTGSDDAVAFEPQGEEDEQAAKQETEYVNYVLHRENNGFLILHDAIKDGLLSKCGYVHWYWDESAKQDRETYDGMTPDAFMMLAQEPGIEIISTEDSEDDPGMIDAVVRRLGEPGKVVIENIPPEDVMVSRAARGTIREARYAAYTTIVTASELREKGISQDLIDEIPTALIGSTNIEQFARSTVQEMSLGGNESLGSERKVEVTKHYIHVDVDEDGRSELLCVLTGGRHASKGKVLIKEYADSIPMAGWSPIRMPHRHIGISIADALRDIQEINTALVRTLLDNAYNTANNRFEVAESHSGEFTLDDLLNNRPGSPIRTKAPGGLQAIQSVPVIQHILPTIEHMLGRREERTGFTRYSQGLTADSLNKTATGITRLMEASNKRLKLIARLFGEVFMRDLVYGLHETILKHATQARTVKLTGGWVQVDPRAWRTRTDMTISIGMGPGQKHAELAIAQQMLQYQMEAIKLQGGVTGPLVTMDNVYALMTRLGELSGIKNVAKYFSAPGTTPPPEPKGPPPEVQKAEIDAKSAAQVATIKAQSDQQIAQMKAMYDAELAKMKLAADAEMTLVKARIDAMESMHDRMAQSAMHDQTRMDAAASADGVAAKGDAGLQAVGQALGALAEVMGRPKTITTPRGTYTAQ